MDLPRGQILATQALGQTDRGLTTNRDRDCRGSSRLSFKSVNLGVI